MPIIKSAKKKLRQDKKRQLDNKKIKSTYKSVVKAAKEKPTAAAINQAFSAIDKAAKKGIIHENKAARLKAGVSKLTNTKTSAVQPTTKVKAVAKSKKKPTIKK